MKSFLQNVLAIIKARALWLVDSKNRLPVSAFLALLLIVLLSGTFWMRLRERFIVEPTAHGAYIGKIKLVSGYQIPMFLEIDDTQLYAAVLLHSSAAPLGHTLNQRILIERARTVATPLTLPLPDSSNFSDMQEMTVTLRGQLNEYDEFTGTVFVSGHKSGVKESEIIDRGQFMLRARAEPRALTPALQRDAQSWVLLQAERATWDEKLAKIATIKDGKLDEIERLKNFVNDKLRLRAGADQKYAAVETQLQAVHDELNGRKEKAQKLSASLALAQRVTPFGRLVTLARESNDRELRWVESMLRVGDQAGPAGIEDDVQRGLEIMGLKDQLVRERARIVALGGDPDA